MQTIKESLKYGVDYEGVTHYDFELRLPMVADNIAVLQEHVGASNMRVRTALFARCLIGLGNIPPAHLDVDFLANNLVDDDFDVLTYAEAALKKKADAAESALVGYRHVCLVLGQFGIPEQRVLQLSMAELDGYMAALNRLLPPTEPPVPAREGTRSHYVSRRHKPKR